MDKIDFVIPWVDGSDPKWMEEKNRYESIEKHDAATVKEINPECRYREDGLLRYWFRGVEKFAPWVNRIHFVTCGQKPEWMNVEHPKLHLVDHKDYIPAQYLPTFSSHVIELNFHRIEELSEHFVYFNDDVFLLQPVEPSLFFRQGLPVLDTNLSFPTNVAYNSWSRVVFNDYCVVNKSFNIKRSILKNWNKWFNIKELGFERARKNLLCYLANQKLPVSTYGHLAFPHLKSMLQDIWDRHPDFLEQTSIRRFRSDDGLNQWLISAWSQAKGQFYPANIKRLGAFFTIRPNNITRIYDVISNGAAKQVCINDSSENTDFENSANTIAAAFEKLLPDKSSFEI